MGDMGEFFRAMDAHKKARRKDNTDKSTEILRVIGVDYEIKNHGAHIIVSYGEGLKIDFWPSTGVWIPRDTQKKRRGVFRLLEYIGIDPGEAKVKSRQPKPELTQPEDGEPPW